MPDGAHKKTEVRNAAERVAAKFSHGRRIGGCLLVVIIDGIHKMTELRSAEGRVAGKLSHGRKIGGCL